MGCFSLYYVFENHIRMEVCMKKKLQILGVFVLVVFVVGAANLNTVLANLPQIGAAHEELGGNPLRGEPSPTLTKISEDGVYNIEGICNFVIDYEPDTKFNAVVSADVDPEFSANIPFGYEGDLYLPGCHVLHYEEDELMREITSKDGVAEVCFAERPDVNLTVFYYVEEPFATSQIWLELPTTHEDGFACASAPYSGEYAPGNKVDTDLPPKSTGGEAETPNDDGGSVVAPPAKALIEASGTYNVGGICSLIVLYKEPYQTDDLHVADALRYDSDPVDDYNYADHDTFPDPEALLFQPGCHVLHYRYSKVTHWEKDETLGEWKICFAAQPGYQMTIYNYLGDLAEQASSWVSLETTVEDGLACAPAFYTGVYVPTGKK